jgi:hypothetical protein
MKVTVHHEFPADDAWERIKKCVATLKNEHADRVSYAEVNRESKPAVIKIGLHVPRFFRLSGILDISATLLVTESEVVIEGPLPAGTGFLEGKIAGLIREHLEKCLT